MMAHGSLIYFLLFLLVSGIIGIYFYYTYNEKRKSLMFRLFQVTSNYRSRFGKNLLNEHEESYSHLEEKLNEFLKQRLSRDNPIRLKLERSGLPIRLEKFLIVLTSIFIFMAIGLHLLFSINLLEAFGMSVFITIFGAYFILDINESRRKNKFIEQLSPAIEIILRGVKIGSQVEKTIQIVTKEIGEPLKEEFQRINRELEFGVDYEKVFHASALRVNVSDYYFFTTSLIIQRKTGGSLSETLEHIIQSLSRTQELRMKIRIFSSEAKASGYLLGALPVCIWLYFSHFSPQQTEFFIHDPQGYTLLKVTIGLVLSGFFVISRMIKLDI